MPSIYAGDVEQSALAALPMDHKYHYQITIATTPSERHANKVI